MAKRVTSIGGIFFKAKTPNLCKHGMTISPLLQSPSGEDDDAPLFEWRDEGIEQQSKIHELPFGRFTRILDPEGNLIELF